MEVEYRSAENLVWSGELHVSDSGLMFFSLLGLVNKTTLMRMPLQMRVRSAGIPPGIVPHG